MTYGGFDPPDDYDYDERPRPDREVSWFTVACAAACLVLSGYAAYLSYKILKEELS